MKDEEYLTDEDLQFIEHPSIKITYGINNKKEYFESDVVFDYIIKLRKLLKEVDEKWQ